MTEMGCEELKLEYEALVRERDALKERLDFERKTNAQQRDALTGSKLSLSRYEKVPRTD